MLQVIYFILNAAGVAFLLFLILGILSIVFRICFTLISFLIGVVALIFRIIRAILLITVQIVQCIVRHIKRKQTFAT